MSKEDAPVPDVVPRKRRQLEQAPPVWLATWLDRDDLSPGDRGRIEAEKRRRKVYRATNAMRVGVIVAQEGMTPLQLAALADVLRETGATELAHATLRPKVHGSLMAICRELGVKGTRALVPGGGPGEEE